MARNPGYQRYQQYRRRRRGGNGKRMPRWLLALIVLGALAGVTFAVLSGVGFAAYQSCISGMRPPEEEIAKLPQGGARIYDSEGGLLFQYLDPEDLRREPVRYEEISADLINATVATEDASFWDNPGVNIRGLARAGWENLSPLSDTPGFLSGTGGSSITQQFVKNVYIDREDREDRTYKRKSKEVCYSIELARKYEKEEIMGWYLSVISYGSIYVGVEAASTGYFGKPASELTLGEAALLAGIPASPSRYDPIENPEAARNRQVHVLVRMRQEGYIDDEEFWTAAGQQIEIQPARFDVVAPHFVFNVVEPQLDRLFGEGAKNRDGLVVHTTLDMRWQLEAERILEENISANEGTYTAHNGAFVAIDPGSAEILVYVGSRDYFNEDIDGQNDMAGALNSPGSAFKPFTYLTTFMELGWGPGTWILDTPYTYQDESGSFTPCNPGGCGSFQGPLSVRDALGNSLNVPAVKAMLYAGVPKVVAQAKRMGLTSLDNQFLGPALTTGGGDVRLVDMVYGFSVFPNLGIQKGIETSLDLPVGNRALDPVSILRVEDRQGNVLYPLVDGQPAEKLPLQEERVAPAAETYMVTDILVDPNAECIIFGCGRLSIPDGRQLAVKTGTSAPYENSRQTGDTWTIAFTPQIVAGSWYGNADNSPIGFATSTTVSWPIIQEFMELFHRDLEAKQFTRPEGLVEAEVCLLSGYKPTPDCPLTTKEDLLAKSAAPWLEATPENEQPTPDGEKEEDPWWRRVVIDTRTNLLASDLTPPQHRADRFFLILPDGLSEFAIGQAREWARRSGATIGQAPTRETSEQDIPVAITSPANGADVQGLVEIIGRARSAAFQRYRLEFNSSGQPGGWRLIKQSNSPVNDGRLAVWNATGLPAGPYTLRLTVVDRNRGDIVTSIRVQVIAAPPPATPVPVPLPTPAPTPTPSGQGPPNGQGPPGLGGN